MAATWQVTSQNLTTQLSETGSGFESVWEVRYRITSGPAVGTVGTVYIPASVYNAESVKSAIDEVTKHNHAVASL